MDDNNNIKLSRPVPPFLRYCSAIIPTAFDDSLSYYEALCALYKWLQTNVINTINHNASVTNDFINKEKELEELFEQLKEYVDTYFENLDVQEEINNKLDEMADDGTLSDIISEYLNSIAIFGFDTVASMKNADNLIDGSYARTMGYYAKNDGGGALYKIRNITNDDVVDEGFIIDMNDGQNQLVAELIIEDNSVNVKQIGAYGDGTHDDRPFILKAINKVPNIYLPTGSYKLSQKIDLTGKCINIYGDGAKLSRRNYTPKTIIISPDEDYAFKTAYPNGCYFKKLSFQGNGIDEMSGTCEQCDFIGDIGIYYVRGQVTQCYFQCTQYGIDRAVDSVIDKCVFANCDIAIYLHGSDNRITNNRIDWNNVGIYLRGATHNIFEGNNFDRQTTYAIDADQSNRNEFYNNLFQRNLVAHLKGAFAYSSFVGNFFIMKHKEDNDDTSEMLPRNAFDVSYFRYNVMTGNYFTAQQLNTNSAINHSDCTFSGNMFNYKNIDSFKVSLGSVTVAANSTASLSKTWASLKTDMGLLGFSNARHFDFSAIELHRTDAGASSEQLYLCTPNNRVTNVFMDRDYNIGVNLSNTSANSNDFDVYVTFNNIDPFYINYGNDWQPTV